MTLLELIEERVAVAVLGVTAETDVEEKIRAERGAWLDAEIRRRLDVIKTNYKSTEAVRINLVLDHGSDAGWRA